MGRDGGQQSLIMLARGTPRYPARGCEPARWTAASLAVEFSLLTHLCYIISGAILGCFLAVPNPAH